MPDSDAAWSRAFASQSISDLKVRDLLARSAVEQCHRLHYLQMASEKLCKAFLIRQSGYEGLALSHCLVAKTLPIVLRTVLTSSSGSRASLNRRLLFIKNIGREIELLSPSCKAAGSREDNTEYPWSAGTSVQAPHRFSFPNLDDESKELVALITLMRAAAEVYLA